MLLGTDKTTVEDNVKNYEIFEKVLLKLSSFENYLANEQNSQEKTITIQGSYYQESIIAKDNSTINIGNQVSVVEIKKALQTILNKIDVCKTDFIDAFKVVRNEIRSYKNEVEKLKHAVKGLFQIIL